MNPGLRAGLSVGHRGLRGLLGHLHVDPPHLPPRPRPGTSHGGGLAAAVVGSCPRQSMHLVGENGGPYLWQIGGASVPPRPGGVGEPLPSVCRERVTHSRVFVKSPLGVGGGLLRRMWFAWSPAHSGAWHTVGLGTSALGEWREPSGGSRDRGTEPAQGLTAARG